MMSKQRVTMADVTRLTRTGQLRDAMALLQKQVQDLGMRSAAAAAVSATKDLAAAAMGLGTASPLAPHADVAGSLGAAFLKTRTPPGLAPSPRGSTVDATRFTDHVFSNRAGHRSYKLYVPGPASDEVRPLVVMLHGCQQSPADFSVGTQMNALAEELGFIVVYPEQSPAANQSRCWNWFVPTDQSRDSGEPSLIAGITRQVMGDVAVDPSRVYVAGLSAGGAAAAIMGSAYPDLYAAVCVHSGLACGAARDVSSAFSAMQGSRAAPVDVLHHPRPTIVFHGDRDHTVNIVNGERVIAQSMGGAIYPASVTHGRTSSGVDYTKSVYTDPAGRPMLEQWVLHGFGHAWSGGNPAGSFTDPRGPDASREMMRFFLDQASRAA